MKSLTQIVNDAYMPHARENIASMYEGPLFNRPDVAKRVRESSDDELVALLKALTPECGT